MRVTDPGRADPGSPAGRNGYIRASGRGYLPWLTALVIVLAVTVAAVTTTIHHGTRTQVPDLAAFTRSAQFTSLDQTSAAALAQEFTQLGHGAPWLAGAAHGISDFCQLSSQESQVVLSQASWSAQCQRAETLYYAFDGTLSRRLGELAGQLTALGWNGAEAARLGSAGTSPVKIGPGTTARPPALPGKASLDLTWGMRGRPLTAVSSLAVAGPGTNSQFYRTIQLTPVNPSTVARQALRAHSYILAIQITVQYYDNPAVHPSSLPSS